MPPDDDPIIRSIREAGVRPLRPGRVGRSSIGGRHPRLVITGVVLLFVLFLLIPTIAMRLTDWLWYREIGFERVFLTKIVAQWTLGLIIGRSSSRSCTAMRVSPCGHPPPGANHCADDGWARSRFHRRRAR
jgi:hypothetical protein